MSSNNDSAPSGEQASGSGNLFSTDVKGLPCFNPRYDPTNLAIRWKRWKRSFNLYLTAKGVTNDHQRVALLGSLRIDDFRTTTPLAHVIVPRRRPVEI